MSRFASIKADHEVRTPKPQSTEGLLSEPADTKSGLRVGKKAVSAYFSPEMSLALRVLALEKGVSLQGLMGEAFDDLLRKYGKHPFGER